MRRHVFPAHEFYAFLYALVFSGLSYLAATLMASSLYRDPNITKGSGWLATYFVVALVIPIALAIQIQRTWKGIPVWATLMAISFYVVGYFFFLLPSFLTMTPGLSY